MFLVVEPNLLINDGAVLYVRRHPDYLEIGLVNGNTLQIDDPEKIKELCRSFDNHLNLDLPVEAPPTDEPTTLWSKLRSVFLKV